MTKKYLLFCIPTYLKSHSIFMYKDSIEVDIVTFRSWTFHSKDFEITSLHGYQQLGIIETK